MDDEHNHYARNAVITIIIILILVSAAAALLIMAGSCSVQKKSAGVSFSISKDYEETESLDKEVVLPGWLSLTFTAATTDIKGDISLYNPRENSGYYDLVFELLCDTDGDGTCESLYRSGPVKAGEHIDEFTINKAIPEGSYDAAILIQPYPEGSYDTCLNNGRIFLTLNAVRKH